MSKNPLKMVEGDQVHMTEEQAIAPRQTGDPVPEFKTYDPGLGSYNMQNPMEYVEFAKLMCQAGPLLPEFMRMQPAICMGIAMRATHWGFDPFALAMEAYQASTGGPVAYQAKVFVAALRNVEGITLKFRYTGGISVEVKEFRGKSGKPFKRMNATGDLACVAYAEVDGELLEYDTLPFDDIYPKNSTLWHNDPKQQLSYYAGRAWVRRYRPGVIMGALSTDEVQDNPQIRDVTPRKTGFAKLGEDARAKAADPTASDDVEKVKGDEPEDAVVSQEPASDDPQTDQSPEDETQEPVQGELMPSYDASNEVSQEGFDAFGEGFARSDNPHKDDPDKARDWFAGYDFAAEEEGAE